MLIVLLLFVFTFPIRAQEAIDTAKINDLQKQDQLSDDQIKQSETVETEKGNIGKSIIIKGRRIKSIDKASTTTDITAKDIKERNDKLLKDVLYQVPGIHVSMQRKGIMQFTIRGYDMSKVAILVDGIPVIDSFGNNMDIDNIGVMNASEIIVNRGSCSALYGTRGSVGSINIIRKEPTELYADVSTEYSEHNNYTLTVSQGALIGNFYYDIFASYDKLNGYTISNKLDRDEREKWLLKLSRYDLYGYTLNGLYNANPALRAYLDDTGLWDHTEHKQFKTNAKAGYHITSNIEAGVSAFYNYTKKETSSYFTDMTSIYAYDPYTEDKDWMQPNASFTLRNLSGKWPGYNTYSIAPYLYYGKDKLKIKSNTYYYEQSSNFLGYADPTEIVLAWNQFPETAYWSIWTDSTYGFNIFPSYELLSWNRLNFSLSYYKSKHTEEEKAYNDESTQIIDYYGTGKYKTMYIEADYLTIGLENEMHIMRNTDLTLGVSYDAQNLIKYQRKSSINGSIEMMDQGNVADDAEIWGTHDSINPVGGIVYEPIKNFLKLKAAGAKKNSFPTLQMYSRTVSQYQDSSDVDSTNAEVKPEKSFNGNAGFELSLFDKQLTWGSDYFYSKYDDKIERIYIAKIQDYIYRNLDSATIQGAEIILKSNFTDVLDIADIDISLTYTYTFARNQTNVDNSTVNKGDKFQKFPEQKLTFDFRTHFKTDTNLIIFGYYENNQIQYTMASIPATTDDFSTSYFHEEKLHDPLMINIKLSQKIYYDHEIYVMCKNILDDYAADPLNPGPGRTWYGGFNAKF